MYIVVTPGFPKNEDETTCLPAVQQMMLALKNAIGADKFCIVTMQYPFESGTYYWNNIQVVALAGKNKKGIFKLITWYRCWQQLGRFKNQHHIEGLLALWLTETALLCQLFGKRHTIKRLFWTQGQDVKAENKYVRLIRPTGDQVLAISQAGAKLFQRNFSINARDIVENGILPESFPELNTGLRPISIIGVGSLTEIKNYKLFVEVVALVKSKLPNITCKQAGKGPEEAFLRAYTSKLGLSHCLEFIGDTPHPVILDLMNQSCILLHTSTFEGSSTVIAEALYMGCQVVSTIDLDGVNGSRLHIATDKYLLSEKIIQLLQQNAPSKRITSNLLSESITKLLSAFND